MYYSTCSATEVIWTDLVGTAATDGVYVYISPDFFRSLGSDSQRAFLLFHEVGHIILRLTARQGVWDRGFFRPSIPFDHATYNASPTGLSAQTALRQGWSLSTRVVTPTVRARRHYSSIRSTLRCITSRMIQDMSLKSRVTTIRAVTNLAATPPQPDDDGDESGTGDKSDTSDDSGDSRAEADTPDESEPELPDAEGHDYHLTPEYEGDDAEQEQAAAEDEHQLRSSVDDGIEQLERDGGDKAGLSNEIREGSHRYRESNASDTDWRAQLADRFNRAGDGGEKTWSRIHRRRYATLGVISPTSIGRIGRVSLVIDISASVQHRTA